jgi:hypothetical protein
VVISWPSVGVEVDIIRTLDTANALISKSIILVAN